MSHPQRLIEILQTTADHESSISSSHISSVSSNSFSSLSNWFLSEKNSPNLIKDNNNNPCLKSKTHKHRTKLTPLSGHLHNQELTPVGSGCFSVSPRSWHKVKLWLGSLPVMASQTDLSIHDQMQSPSPRSSASPCSLTKKIITGQQKEELEREVTVLHKMLAHEQKVHEYLERLQHRQDGSALSIPNFLPPKVKEILAELAMVENEIMRLESQITHLQTEMKNEKQIKTESKSKEWERGTMKNYHDLPPLPNSRKSSDKVAFETKTLHFISKAIKGDYNLSDFRTNEKNSKLFSPQKENDFHAQAQEGLYREKVAKRSGMLKAPSPLREPRHPTPRRDRNLESPMETPSRVLSTPLHTEEESIQRWSPNKLSENIMKCLIFIFVRLLRTSRTMELEKSGPIARSTNFSLSFRQESNSNSKSSLKFQKDSRQQDPYGIFDSEESLPRDIGPYKNLVKFTSSCMDLKCIQNSSSVPLFQKLKILMDGLQKVDLRFLSHQQKLAFWINMYNACVMHGFLQYGIPSVCSPESLLELINKASLNIAGNIMNAQAIEHFILRKPADSLVNEILGRGDNDKKEMIVRELYGIETPDSNITFALCCGTRSSPAVKIYTADGVQAELERAKQEYLQAAIIVTNTRNIALPELLLRNMQDFAQDNESLMEWVCHQLPTSGTLRKSIVECFRGIHGSKTSAIIEKIPHDFEFQYLLAM